MPFQEFCRFYSVTSSILLYAFSCDWHCLPSPSILFTKTDAAVIFQSTCRKVKLRCREGRGAPAYTHETTLMAGPWKAEFSSLWVGTSGQLSTGTADLSECREKHWQTREFQTASPQQHRRKNVLAVVFCLKPPSRQSFTHCRECAGKKGKCAKRKKRKSCLALRTSESQSLAVHKTKVIWTAAYCAWVPVVALGCQPFFPLVLPESKKKREEEEKVLVAQRTLLFHLMSTARRSFLTEEHQRTRRRCGASMHARSSAVFPFQRRLLHALLLWLPNGRELFHHAPAGFCLSNAATSTALSRFAQEERALAN